MTNTLNYLQVGTLQIERKIYLGFSHIPYSYRIGLGCMTSLTETSRWSYVV